MWAKDLQRTGILPAKTRLASTMMAAERRIQLLRWSGLGLAEQDWKFLRLVLALFGMLLLLPMLLAFGSCNKAAFRGGQGKFSMAQSEILLCCHC